MNKYIGKNINIIDHIDRNGLNNQKNNIRICTYGENTHNAKNCGKYPKGVIIYKKEYKNKKNEKIIYVYYRAQITVDKKRIPLGYYKTIKEAEATYKKAAIKYYKL